MIHKQGGIPYKIESNVLKGWIGTSPFKKPQWNGTEIVEGWKQSDEDMQILQAKLILRDALKVFRKEAVLIISVYREFNTSASNEFTTARTAFVDKYNIIKAEILALNELEEIGSYIVDLKNEVESLGLLI